MTTIAYRDGILAGDSAVTYESEAGGTRKHRCATKLFRKTIITDGDPEEIIIAVQGDSSAAAVFVSWFDGTEKPLPDQFLYHVPDFTCLVLREGGLWEYDAYCIGEKIVEPFYAMGSGAKAALGAMHMGASAEEAVRIACLFDPYTAQPINAMHL